MHYDVLDERGNVIGSADSGYESREEAARHFAKCFGITTEGLTVDEIIHHVNEVSKLTAMMKDVFHGGT